MGLLGPFQTHSDFTLFGCRRQVVMCSTPENEKKGQFIIIRVGCICEKRAVYLRSNGKKEQKSCNFNLK